VFTPSLLLLRSCNVFGDGNGASDSDIAACISHSINVKAHHAINLS
jgi:hypothetical protein